MYQVKDNKLGLYIQSIKNLTSGMDIVKETLDAAKEGLITVIEIGDYSMVIEIETKKAAEGHLVIILGRIEIGNEKYNLDAHGKIVELENVNEKMDKVTIKLYKVDENVWNKIQSVQSERQNKVELLFNKMKGRV